MDKISIIQGDGYEAKLRFSGIPDVRAIKRVTFSCNFLNLCKEVEYDEEEGAFILRFTPRETSSLTPCVTDFDITVEFDNENVQTPIYRKSITIQRKVNLCGNNRD